MFSKPKALAKMLNIPVEYILHFVAIMAILDSKKALPIPDAFEAFCNEHLDKKFLEPKYKWNHHNVIIVSLSLSLSFMQESFVNYTNCTICFIFSPLYTFPIFTATKL